MQIDENLLAELVARDAQVVIDSLEAVASSVVSQEDDGNSVALYRFRDGSNAHAAIVTFENGDYNIDLYGDLDVAAERYREICDEWFGEDASEDEDEDEDEGDDLDDLLLDDED